MQIILIFNNALYQLCLDKGNLQEYDRYTDCFFTGIGHGYVQTFLNAVYL